MNAMKNSLSNTGDDGVTMTAGSSHVTMCIMAWLRGRPPVHLFTPAREDAAKVDHEDKNEHSETQNTEKENDR